MESAELSVHYWSVYHLSVYHLSVYHLSVYHLSVYHLSECLISRDIDMYLFLCVVSYIHT